MTLNYYNMYLKLIISTILLVSGHHHVDHVRLIYTESLRQISDLPFLINTQVLIVTILGK